MTQGPTLALPGIDGPKVPPCEPGHATFKSDNERWEAAPFGGIQPLGHTLSEGRHCPLCGSTVVRPVSFGRALAMLLDELLSASPPTSIAVKSATALKDWAERHTLAIPYDTTPPEGNHGRFSG